jgi:hypothetical protein
MTHFANHSCPRLPCDGFSTKHQPQRSPTYLTDGPLDGSDSCCLLPRVGRLLALIYLHSARYVSKISINSSTGHAGLGRNRAVFRRVRRLRAPSVWADSAEIAKAAVFLASDESSYVAGIELFVDGGAVQV